jgi:hypothetical protein
VKFAEWKNLLLGMQLKEKGGRLKIDRENFREKDAANPIH